jgi:hypothetical protein
MCSRVVVTTYWQPESTPKKVALSLLPTWSSYYGAKSLPFGQKTVAYLRH